MNAVFLWRPTNMPQAQAAVGAAGSLDFICDYQVHLSLAPRAFQKHTRFAPCFLEVTQWSPILDVGSVSLMP